MEALFSILLPVLMQIESGSDPNAVGDGGRAVGCLQIHACVIDDVNETFATRYTEDDRRNVARSMTIARLYLLRWGCHYQKKTGKDPTLEVLARIWNGGPNGWKKASTDAYWNKVQKELKHECE